MRTSIVLTRSMRKCSLEGQGSSSKLIPVIKKVYTKKNIKTIRKELVKDIPKQTPTSSKHSKQSSFSEPTRENKGWSARKEKTPEIPNHSFSGKFENENKENTRDYDDVPLSSLLKKITFSISKIGIHGEIYPPSMNKSVPIDFSKPGGSKDEGKSSKFVDMRLENLIQDMSTN